MKENKLTLAVAKTKEYSMKGMTQAQAQGKAYVNAIVDELVSKYQFFTIKRQIGFLKDNLRENERKLKYIKEDLMDAKGDVEWTKDLENELEQFTMVKTILTDMLSVMVSA